MKTPLTFPRTTVPSLLLALLVATTPPWDLTAAVISDFNQTTPDWIEGILTPRDYAFELGNGHLTITVDSAGSTGGDYDLVLWDVDDMTVSDGATLELRLDLISSTLTEFNGGPFFGFEWLADPPSSVSEGYYFLKFTHVRQLAKYRNYTLDGQRFEQVASLLWDFGGDPIKHDNVRLVLTAAGMGDDLLLTVSILDLDDNLNVLYTNSFLDTTAQDPHTASSGAGEGGAMSVLPHRRVSHAWLGAVTGPTPVLIPGSITVDNFEYSFTPAPAAEGRLQIHRAIELTWLTDPGKNYRLYRSLGDLEHFFPLPTTVAGNGQAVSVFEPAHATHTAYYQLQTVPPSLNLRELVSIHSAFREAVHAQQVDLIASLFQPNMVFEDVPTQRPVNRQGLIDWFTDLFRLFPDYTDSDGVFLTGKDSLVIEHVGSGTHLADWELEGLGTIPATGKSLLFPHLGVFELEGNRIFRYLVYQDYLGILVQLGVVPAPELPVLVPSFDVPTPEPSGLSALATVEQAISLWNAHDLSGLLRLVAADADIYFNVFGAPLTRDQYAASQEGYLAAFPDLVMQPQRTVDLGQGWVLSEVVWFGTNTGPYFGMPATERPATLKGVVLYRVEATGSITYLHAYFDNLTLLGQLGLL